jgi:arginase
VRPLAVLGVPSSAGAYAAGQERAPEALRGAGLVERLDGARDLGDGPLVGWRPDREQRLAQNAGLVVRTVRETAERVRQVVAADETALVLGGDCTVGLGAIAGVVAAAGDAAVLYLDLHADLNTPASVRDGALDWMGLAHALDLPDTVPELVSAGPRVPLLTPGDLVLVGWDPAQATSHERATVERLGLQRVGVDAVAADPTTAARRALALLPPAAPLVIHADVDLIDFVDAPLSENTGRNIGVPLQAFAAALRTCVADPRFTALTVTELNPDHAVADEHALPRLTSALADALAQRT